MNYPLLQARPKQLFDASPLPREYRQLAGEREATIWLYDVIGDEMWGGVSAKTFVKDLTAITAPTIHLRINSPGGDVFDARAMVTALRQHPARIIAHIDGLAASAASYISLAADEVEMADGAFLMIHNAWSVVVGNRHDLLDMAETLEKIDATILTDYQARTGQSSSDIQAWMDKETWFTTTEALDAGFVDRIAAPPEQTPSPKPSALAAHHLARARRVSLLERILP